MTSIKKPDPQPMPSPHDAENVVLSPLERRPRKEANETVRDSLSVHGREENLEAWADEIGFGHDDFFLRCKPVQTVHWSVAWADLMMTMFVLFLVLFVYISSHPGEEVNFKEGVQAYSGVQVVSKVVDNGLNGKKDAAEESGVAQMFDFNSMTDFSEELKQFAAIDLDPDRTMRIILTGDLLFLAGESRLREKSKQSLMKIADFLKDTPYLINIVGHTDSVPIKNRNMPSNWELSVFRACTVARFLIKETGLAPEQFFVSGHAENRPLAPNDSPENRSKNRRVEIVVTKEIPMAISIE